MITKTLIYNIPMAVFIKVFLMPNGHCWVNEWTPEDQKISKCVKLRQI